MNSNEIVLGIDLGTSNSAACVYIDNEAIIIPSSEGSMYGNVFPSYVTFTDKEILVGELAKKQFKKSKNAENTVRAIKKDMGTDKRMKFQGELYSPQQISSFILQKIKWDAEKFLGKPVKKAVITVPANFNNHQRNATKDAGRIAGLEVQDLINEPTAACLAYGMDNMESGPQNILVFDMGGGTLDVTIMKIQYNEFNVLSTSGNLNLGGTNMDNAIFKYLQDEFKNQNGIGLPNDQKTKNRFLDQAEMAKIDLSNSLEAHIDLEVLTLDSDGSPIELDFSTTLTRSKLEKLVEPIINQCNKPIIKALDDAGLSKEDIDKLILVGGPTKMPIVKEFVENFMGKPAVKGIDPMVCVARGAAINAGIVSGEIKKLSVWDVTPLSLGLISHGGITDVLIKRNTKIPTVVTKKYQAVRENQKRAKIEIVQGENKMALDNTYLGSFLLNLKPGQGKKSIVEVTFKMEEDGILNVVAKDKSTGNMKSVILEDTNQLTEFEIRKAVKKAKENEKNNIQREKIAILKNRADDLIYESRKLVNSDLLGYKDKTNIESLISNLNKSLDENNVLKINSDINKLAEALKKSR